jgi:hypothetical protein
MNDHISIPPTAADAYRAMLAEQTYASLEADTLNEAEENEFSHSKNKKENYAKFLAANADRVGKPMIDGGLKTTDSDADTVNGKPVNSIIYLGDGCVTFEERGKKTFMQMQDGWFNTSDGTVPWSTWKNYAGSNPHISILPSKFKDIAKAVALAAKV